MIEGEPHGIALPTETLPFSEIHNSFAASEHGQYLARRLRFNDYRPEHVSGEAWEILLGRDVNNLRHLDVARQMTGEFLRVVRIAEHAGEKLSSQAKFDSDDETRLLLTATFHDWGESVTGCEDITYRLKTEADEDREHAALQTIFQDQAVAVTRSPEDAQALHDEMESARAEILRDRTSKLGRAFNAVERMGYLRTALRGLRVAAVHEDDSVRNSMEWIAADVFGGQVIQLLEYGNVFPAVREFLAANSEGISQGFSTVPDKAFDNYDEIEQATQREKFATARVIWESVNAPAEQTSMVAVG